MTDSCALVQRVPLRLYDWSLFLTPGADADLVGVAVQPDAPMVALCRAASAVTAALMAASGGLATIVELERDDETGAQYATGHAVRADYANGAVRWQPPSPGTDDASA